MSLIVETGAGLSTAESYASVAEATTYHAAFGNAAWALAVLAAQEVALRKATQYLDAKYHNRWTGVRVNSTQALDWPRAYADTDDQFYIASDVVPTQVKNATAEMALRALTDDILADIDEPGGLTAKKVKVGSIEIERKWESGPQSQTPIYRVVDGILQSILTQAGQVYRA